MKNGIPARIHFNFHQKSSGDSGVKDEIGGSDFKSDFKSLPCVICFAVITGCCVEENVLLKWPKDDDQTPVAQPRV
jgi:hypothetical protein